MRFVKICKDSQDFKREFMRICGETLGEDLL